MQDTLLANGRQQQEALQTGQEIDFVPVVMLEQLDTGCCWLLTELDPADPDVAYGLADIQNGAPEVKRFSLDALWASFYGSAFSISIDPDWQPTGTFSAYVAAAKANGYIIELDES